MLQPRFLLVVTLTSALVLSGCEAGRRFIRKPWGQGTYIPAAVCAVVGGVVGATIESQGFTNQSIRSGESCVTVNGVQTCSHDKPDYPAAAAIGAGAGALLCGLVGHYIWDPEVVTPTRTPEPLPPVPTPVTRISTAPSVSSQISRAVVRRWISGFARFSNCWGIRVLGKV